MSDVPKCLECDQYAHKGHYNFCSFLETPMLHLNRLADETSRLYYEATIFVEPDNTIDNGHFANAFEAFTAATDAFGWRTKLIHGDWVSTKTNERSGQLIADLRAICQIIRDAGLTILRVKIVNAVFDTQKGDEM